MIHKFDASLFARPPNSGFVPIAQQRWAIAFLGLVDDALVQGSSPAQFTARPSEQGASLANLAACQHQIATFRNRTPGPSPFSAMKITPAASRARRITSRLAR